MSRPSTHQAFSANSAVQGAGFVLRGLRLLFVAALVVLAVWLLSRWMLLDAVQRSVIEFFMDTLGLPEYTARAAGWLSVVAAALVSFRTLLAASTGRLSWLAGAVGAALITAVWSLQHLAQAPVKADGSPRQRYAVLDGRCQYFDLSRPFDPRTGVQLLPVTQESLALCRRLELRQTPRALSVARLQSMEWFDPATGVARVYFARRGDDAVAFFDGPGFDPLSSQRLLPVTPTLVAQWHEQRAIEAARQTTEAEHTTPAPAASAPVATPESMVNAGQHPGTAPAQAGTPRTSPNTTVASAPRAWHWLHEGPVAPTQANPMQALRLQRANDVRVTNMMGLDMATGLPEPAMLASLGQAGYGRVAVLRTQRSVDVEPRLSGFTTVRIRWRLDEFDAQTGVRLASAEGEQVGRGFSEVEADSQAWRAEPSHP